jgi:hypothetical protein
MTNVELADAMQAYSPVTMFEREAIRRLRSSVPNHLGTKVEPAGVFVRRILDEHRTLGTHVRDLQTWCEERDAAIIAATQVHNTARREAGEAP